ncbi:hypothetical protein PsYK624_121020 [Phanerochaete sordida]|uniref:Uncharacterized protein n=1 Tax=Phanerochaete sordida TaxID=48140 RepID=A0A9P3GJG5_9APHY|nr:hypothetical protein PsYK624_121020 [Phanerochaete sordida]
MLGYGGTDKPEDPAAYIGSLLVQDLVEILDEERVDKAVVIGVTSLLRALRAYFTGSYVPPHASFDLQAFLDGTKAIGGRDLFGYWEFFGADPEAEKIIEAYIDSFICQWFPQEPEVWRDCIAPRDAHKKNLLADKIVPLGPYMTEENVEYFRDTFAQGGWAGPLNWYRAAVHGSRSKDDAATQSDTPRADIPAS